MIKKALKLTRKTRLNDTDSVSFKVGIASEKEVPFPNLKLLLKCLQTTQFLSLTRALHYLSPLSS